MISKLLLFKCIFKLFFILINRCHAVRVIFVFFFQQFIYALIRPILLIQEIDHHHIVLLAVAVTAPDALFHALWVPGQVEVKEIGAVVVKVHALPRRVGGDEHLFFEYTRLILGEEADLDYIAAANHGDTQAIKAQLRQKFPPLTGRRFPYRYIAVGYPPVGLLTLLLPRL